MAWHPSRIAACLLAREAGLAENTPTTEPAVEAITSHLAEDLRMNPFVQRPGSGRRGQETPAAPAAGSVRGALRRALRESTYTIEAARAEAEPTSLALQPQAEAAVAKARAGPGGNLVALPLYREDQRVAARDRADSVLRDALRSWLGSEEAREWRASRRALFGTGAADPEAASQPS